MTWSTQRRGSAWREVLDQVPVYRYMRKGGREWKGRRERSEWEKGIGQWEIGEEERYRRKEGRREGTIVNQCLNKDDKIGTAEYTYNVVILLGTQHS